MVEVKKYEMRDNDIYIVYANDAEEAARKFEARQCSHEVDRKLECEEYGGTWVPSFHKKDGTKVHGYCRW